MISMKVAKARNAKIIASYKKGNTMVEIAGELGISRSTVQNIVQKAGLSRGYSHNNGKHEEKVKLPPVTAGGFCSRCGILRMVQGGTCLCNRHVIIEKEEADTLDYGPIVADALQMIDNPEFKYGTFLGIVRERVEVKAKSKGLKAWLDSHLEELGLTVRARPPRGESYDSEKLVYIYSRKKT